MPLLKEESQKYNSSVALLLIDVINDLNFEQCGSVTSTGPSYGKEDCRAQTQSRAATDPDHLRK